MPRIEIPSVRPGRDLFQTGTASQHDAILDGSTPSWSVYVEGYRLAADDLVDLALSDSGKRDFVIYPILFLYRQYLELSLKEVLVYLEHLGDRSEVSRRDHHRLQDLWAECKRQLAKYADDSLGAHTTIIESAAEQFAALDPTSQLFRYPESKRGLVVSYPLARVNLRVLRTEMKNAALAMGLVAGGLSALVDQRREFLAEMRP